MDVIFNCPKCNQELEVDSSGIGEVINCPSCNQKITIPDTATPRAPSAPAAPTAPKWGVPAINAIASSAAAKVEMHLKVPQRPGAEKLITKPPPPLDVAAKESDRKLRVKTIRHGDCVEVGHDKFDEVIAAFLEKIGETNLVSITPITYSTIDIASQKAVSDYGVLIVFRG